MMSFLPGWAVGEAGGVLVGQSLGARRPDLARQAWRSATTLAVTMMGVFALLFVTQPTPLLGLFHPEAAVLDLGRRMLWIAAFFQVFDAIATVGLCCLNGAGDNRFVMALQVVASWLLKVPTAWLFALYLGLGAPGAWMGMTLDIMLLAAASLWRIRGEAWLGAAPPPEPELREALA
jgi:MATE family multidrug resistance protein